MLDLLLKGGTVVDGTGAPARTADVGIRDGIVVEVGRADGGARRVLDADGLLVTPGWPCTAPNRSTICRPARGG